MVEPVNKNVNDKNEVIALLRQRIIDSIDDEKAISISIEDACMTLLESIYIGSDDYELDENHLYFNKNKFDLNIIFDDVTRLEYNNDYEEYFKMVHNNTEINLYFYN